MYLVTTLLVERVAGALPTFHGALSLQLKAEKGDTPTERKLELVFQAATQAGLILSLAIRDGKMVLNDGTSIDRFSLFVGDLCKGALARRFARHEIPVEELKRRGVLETVLELCYRKKVYPYILVCNHCGEIIGRLELNEPTPLAIGDGLKVNFDACQPVAQFTRSKKRLYGKHVFVVNAISTDGVPCCEIDESILS